MKKILVLALLLFALNAKSQTKYETEKWLAEKLYAFGSSRGGGFMQKVEIVDCHILMYFGFESERGYEMIPINSILAPHTMLDGSICYYFKGNIKIREYYNGKDIFDAMSYLRICDVPNDMLERIKKALEHYKKLCGIDEVF